MRDAEIHCLVAVGRLGIERHEQAHEARDRAADTGAFAVAWQRGAIVRPRTQPADGVREPMNVPVDRDVRAVAEDDDDGTFAAGLDQRLEARSLFVREARIVGHWPPVLTMQRR